MSFTRNEIILAILAGFLLLGGCALVLSMSSIFLPVFFAFILAYLLNPLVNWLENKKCNRPLAILLVFCVIFMALAASAAFLIDSLRSEFRDVEINLPQYANSLYNHIPQQVKVYLDIETPEKVYQQINAGLDAFRGVSFNIAKEALAVVTKAFTSTLSFVLAIIGYFIIPVYLYYLLADMSALKSGALAIIPERFREAAVAKAAEIDEVLSSFVRGQLLVCALLAVLYSIGLYFIDIDLALVIGVTAGIGFIIPYFGTILGIVLSTVMAVLKFHDLLHPLLCIGWFGLVQLLEGSIITPKIVGDKVGLHPMLAILALFVGGQLFGLLGMLLAVPAAAVIKVFTRSLLSLYRESAYYRGA